MLILERTPGEAVTIGDDIQVVVLSVNGNQSRVGVIAPKKIAVHRAEIFHKILEENGATVRSAAPADGRQ